VNQVQGYHKAERDYLSLPHQRYSPDDIGAKLRLADDLLNRFIETYRSGEFDDPEMILMTYEDMILVAGQIRDLAFEIEEMEGVSS